MAQIFRQRSNTLARVSLLLVVLATGGSMWALDAVYWSPYTTRVNMPREQPVPFSHKHHAYGMGIDCRYCHTSVEKSAFAGIPPTETCMTCHSQLWTGAPLLAPVRESLAEDQRLHWNRVHQLPDFVFFNHSIHVNKGIGCSTCHGQVEQMPLTWQVNTLYMKWCLDCHRNPEKYIRPRAQVFNQQWESTNQAALGPKLVAQYHVQVTQLTDCSMCHR
jgi:ferredoxin